MQAREQNGHADIASAQASDASSVHEVPRWLSGMPKCNLHSHMEGSITPSLCRELAERCGKAGDLPSHFQLESLLCVTGTEQSLADYLVKVRFANAFLATEDCLEHAAWRVALCHSDLGVIYLELRAAPLLHVADDLSVADVICAILRGLHRAERETGMVARLIVTALKRFPVNSNVELAEISASLKSEGVVGFDLAGDEARYQAADQYRAIARAASCGLPLTIHAGEVGSAENVRQAVEDFGAVRVGHGIRAIDSPEIMEILIRKNVLLEICPTSNVHTRAVSSIGHHPVRKLFDANILVAIADDDPATSRTDISKELTILHDTFAFTPAEMRRLQLNAVHGAFLSEGKIRTSIESRIQNWESPP